MEKRIAAPDLHCFLHRFAVILKLEPTVPGDLPSLSADDAWASHARHNFLTPSGRIRTLHHEHMFGHPTSEASC